MYNDLFDINVNGSHLSDGIAGGVSNLTPDRVTALKLPFLNTAAFTSNVTKYPSWYLRDRNASGQPYIDVRYAPSPGGGGWTFVQFNQMPMKVSNVTGASFGAMKMFTLPFGVYTWAGGAGVFTKVDWSDTTLSTGSGIGSGGSGDFSWGSTASADATLSGTDVDIVASTAFLDPFVSGIGRSNVYIGWANSSTAIDGSTETTGGTAKTVNLNVIIDDTDVADADESIIQLTGLWRFKYNYHLDYDF